MAIIERVYRGAYGLVRLQHGDELGSWCVKRATPRLERPPDINNTYPQDFKKKADVIVSLLEAGLPVEMS